MRSIPILVCFIMISSGIFAQVIPPPAQTDSITIDNGTPGSADPGDRIRYKVTIVNTGAANGNGVQLTINPDPNTTFVPGSFRSSPLALPDAYLVTGNVGITVPAAMGLLANDFDDNIPGLTITAGTFGTVQGGSIMISADGSFTYTPPAGFTGTDTYIYTLNDGNGVGGSVPTTDMATVTFTIADLIWFINNSSMAATSDGRLTSPFKSIADFNANSTAAAAVVYIEHTGVNYTGPLNLALNERLFGEGHTGGANLANVLPFALAPNSPALPNINGSRPIITSAGSGIVLAMNNAIRGIEVGATGTAKIFGAGPFGNLTIGSTTTPDVLLSGAGQALNLTNGTFVATSQFISVATTSSTSQGIILQSVAGTIVMGSTSVSGSATQGILVSASTANINFGNTTVAAATDGVSLQNNSAGTRTFGTLTTTNGSGTGFLHAVGGGTTIVGNTTITTPGGTGIDIQSSTTAVTFGNTTVTKTAAGTGVNLGGAATGNSGAVTFNSLAITTANGAGLVGTNNTGQITVTTNTGSISSAAGAAINISRTSGNTPVTLNFTNVGTTSSATNGIAFTNVSGAFTAGGGTLSGITGTAFLVSGGTIVSSYGGTITGNSALAVDIDNHDTGNITFQTGNIVSTTQGIRVQNSNGGTIEFNNPSKSLTTTTNAGVNLINNTGATINFGTGGLVIVTSSGVGFNATGGGTINVLGTTNTINSTANSAMNVGNTTIGASNLNFLSISSSNTASGILLNTTGATGGLIVTGSGTTNASGGTILNISARGVNATSTSNLSLKNMAFTNANTVDAAPCGAADNSGCNAAIYLNLVTNVTLDNVDISGTTTQQGINAREVSGLQLLNSTIINAGTGPQGEEGGLYALNLFGTSQITNTSITFPGGRGVTIYNTSKTLILDVTSSNFDDTQSSAVGADGFEISTFGTSNTTIDILNSFFRRNKTNGLQSITEDNSFTSLDMQGNTFDYGSFAGGGGGIDIDAADDGDVDFNIIGNTLFRGAQTSVVNIFAQGTSSMEGRFNTNPVQSGGGSGTGIRCVAQEASTMIIEINGNTVTGINLDNGIDVISRAGTGRMDAIISSNNVTTVAGANAEIRAAAGASGSVHSNKTCAWVKNNTVSTLAFSQLEGRVVNAHELILQGGGASMAANWNANTNAPVSPPAVMNPLISGAGMITFAGVCNAPANPAISF